MKPWDLDRLDMTGVELRLAWIKQQLKSGADD